MREINNYVGGVSKDQHKPNVETTCQESMVTKPAVAPGQEADLLNVVCDHFMHATIQLKNLVDV